MFRTLLSTNMEHNFTKLFILLLCLVWSCIIISCSEEELSKKQFPDGFMFGVSTSAYQIEGAVLEDGRGPNNWDKFCHTEGKIDTGETADVAADHYHRFQEDIELLDSLGLNAYRFSFSWTRILPRGRFGDINQNGIMFYHKIIDRLLSKGIEPMVTLSHHDLPLELETKYKGWLNPLVQDDFAYYAEICFKNFGDRVKYWVTINEPILFINSAYVNGIYPPGRCSAPFGNCTEGNSDVEPLIAIHNMILSHSKAAGIYRKHYQPKQKGNIGIVVSAGMLEPFGDNERDREATKRALAFNVPWVLDPLIHGDYPPEMREIYGSQMPKFSAEESNQLKGGIDFIGVNHYTTHYVKDCLYSPCSPVSNRAKGGYAELTNIRDGVLIGEPTAMQDVYVVPDGMEKIIRYLKTRYNNKPMIVTENGFPENGKPINQVDDLLHDVNRVEFHKSYLASLARAIRNGADVRGYFVWSLMDNFEWKLGYSLRFGLYYVDFQTLERRPKLSARWYRNFLTNSSKSADLPRIKMISQGQQKSITLY